MKQKQEGLMIIRFMVIVLFAFALAPAAVKANTALEFYIAQHDYIAFAYWPHEHCRLQGGHMLLCKSADPNGSTIGISASTKSCFIDFERKNDRWELRSVRGQCTAEFDGDDRVYVRGK